MNRIIVTVFLSILCCILTAQSLEITDFERIDSDVSARVTASKLDNYGKPMALFKISTALTGVSVTGTGLCEVEAKTGELWVYVNEGTFNIKVAVEGYERLVYRLPETAKSATVYRMKLRGDRIDKLNVLFITEPGDAEKWLDDELLGTGDSYIVTPGEYTLQVRKQGYKSYVTTIIVDEKHVLFRDIVLPTVEPVLFTVRSVPQGAGISIDNAPYGNTDCQVPLYPGTYHLRLNLAGYEPWEREITVTESGSNTITGNLVKTTSTLTLKIVPANAEVLINNVIENRRMLEKGPGAYKIEVRKDGYEPETRMITIEKGTPRTETFSLKQQTGRLTFTVKPIEAQITLNNGYKWQGGKIRSLPVGHYTATATCEGYEQTQQAFRIDHGAETRVDMVMEAVEKKDDSQPLQDSANELADGPKEVKALKSHTSPTGIEMIFVEGGTFQMGSNEGEDDEGPVHSVTVPSFYIGKFELTQIQWEIVMGDGPSEFAGDNMPIKKISWFDAVEFCNKLSRKEGLTPCYTGSGDRIRCNFAANGYRLPTEAEWEYAARGGKRSEAFNYSGSNMLGDVGWFGKNSENKTHEVGSKLANELGLYDMSGNVSEWCWDWYKEDYYTDSPSANPTGPNIGSHRVRRGGYWTFNADCCKVAKRSYGAPFYASNYVGFRVCRTAE